MTSHVKWTVAAAVLPLAFVCVRLQAQDRLKTMPGYDQYQRMSREIPASVALGTLSVEWKEDGSSFEYAKDGKRYRFDIASKQAMVIGDASEGDAAGRGGRGGRAGQAVAGQGGRGRGNAQGGQQPARGRQFDVAASPDNKWKAFYRDRNLWLSAPDGSGALAVTSDGNEKDRTKYTTGTWVYGEELSQRTAMWWSPDSRRLAYYRIDEKPVLDFYLQMDQTRIQDSLDVEAYPKPGQPNPVVDLFVYDVAAKAAVRVDVRDGKPFADDVVGYYVYDVGWSQDGSEILVHRTNRKQNILELAACRPDTGKCRAVVREAWPTGSMRIGRSCIFSRTASASSGNRAATAGRTSTCTICRAA